ncbi:MAG TPA: hypothetical protein VND64_26300 [Pirellulales bacterium]|nr:hypothetical protein [Pirellulales bacterium]
MSTPEDVAEDFIRKRWVEIQRDLARLNIVLRPEDIFEPPKAERDLVHVREPRESRIGTVVATDVPHLLNGQVSLEIRETYSFAEMKADPTLDPRLLNYSYQFSYMPELLIENRNLLLGTEAKSHWGDLLLTQRRLVRFDGEDQDAWQAKDLRYRNEHFVNHWHAGPGEFFRWPVQQRPSVLAVASLILFSFRYETWLQMARDDVDVLAATQILLPHVLAA